MLETIEVETAPQPNAAVIWLHGLGADGHDFEPIVPELVPQGSRAWRFVFPNAPTRPVTINGGMRMRAWYDIVGLDRKAAEDADGFQGHRSKSSRTDRPGGRARHSGEPHRARGIFPRRRGFAVYRDRACRKSWPG